MINYQQTIQNQYSRRFGNRLIGQLYSLDYNNNPPTKGGVYLSANNTEPLLPGYGVYLVNDNQWVLPTLDTDSYLITHIVRFDIQDTSTLVAQVGNQNRQVQYLPDQLGNIFGFREGNIVVATAGTVSVGERLAFQPTTKLFVPIASLPAQTGAYKTTYEVTNVFTESGTKVDEAAVIRARQA